MTWLVDRIRAFRVKRLAVRYAIADEQEVVTFCGADLRQAESVIRFARYHNLTLPEAMLACCLFSKRVQKAIKGTA